MADFTPTLTEAQALDVIKRGVLRETRQDSERTLAYCTDAVKLRGFNVRKLAQRLEAIAANDGQVFNSDSYQSNVSNANGVMGLFDYDIDAFKLFLNGRVATEELEAVPASPIKSLKALFNAFRQLFTDPKPAKPKAPKTEGDKADGESTETKPLIDVVLAAIPLLTSEERALVSMLIIECDTLEADKAETAETVAA